MWVPARGQGGGGGQYPTAAELEVGAEHAVRPFHHGFFVRPIQVFLHVIVLVAVLRIVIGTV